MPRVLAHDLGGTPPWAAVEELPGEVAYVAAGDDLSGGSFPAIARDLGVLVRRMGRLDPGAFDLPRLWTDGRALHDSAGRWPTDLAPYLSTADTAAAWEIIEAVPTVLGNRPAVVCHGDFGPQKRACPR